MSINLNDIPLYTFLDYFNRTSQKNTYATNFYLHQDTLRNNIYKLSKESTWLYNPRFGKAIGLLQKAGNRYQFGHWFAYNMTKTYSLVNKLPSMYVIDKPLSTSIVNSVTDSNNYTETFVGRVPVRLEELDSFPKIYGYSTSKEYNSSSNRFVITSNIDIESDKNYRLIPLFRKININNTDFNVSAYGKLSVKLSFDKVKLETITSTQREVKCEKRGSGYYYYSTGNTVTTTYTVEVDAGSEVLYNDFNDLRSPIFDINSTKPFILIPFTLDDNIITYNNSLFTLEITDGYNRVSVNCKYDYTKESMKLGTLNAELKSYSSYSLSGSTNSYFLKVYLPIIETTESKMLYCQVESVSSMDPKGWTLSRCSTSSNKKLVNDISKSNFIYENGQIKYFINAEMGINDNLARKVHGIKISSNIDTSHLENYIHMNTTEYYASNIEGKVYQVDYAYSYNSSLSKAGGSYITTTNIYENTFKPTQNNIINRIAESNLFIEDLYYQLRGKYVESPWEEQRINNIDRLLENLLKNDKESIDLNNAYLQSDSLLTFYNYAKGIDTFIKQDSLDRIFDPIIIDKNLISDRNLEYKIVLENSLYQDASSNNNSTLRIFDNDRELLERLAQYDKFPINKMYDKYMTNKEANKYSYGDNQVKYQNDYLKQKLSIEKNNNNSISNATKLVDLMISGLCNYAANGNKHSLLDVKEGLFKIAATSLKEEHDKMISDEVSTEKKRVYDIDSFDIDNLIEDLLTPDTKYVYAETSDTELDTEKEYYVAANIGSDTTYVLSEDSVFDNNTTYFERVPLGTNKWNII